MLQSAAPFFPTKIGMSVQHQQQVRETIRLWLSALTEKHRTNGRQLALTAKVSPSTVYRALEPDNDFVMSSTTMTKIARAYNEPLPPAMGGPAPIAQQQIMRTLGFSDGDLADMQAPLPAVPATPEANIYRARVTSEVLNLEGVWPGDLVEFDLAATPVVGDIVVAQHYFTNRIGAETVLRLYQPPYLLTRSSNAMLDPTPLLVDGARVRITGTFKRLVRERVS